MILIIAFSSLITLLITVVQLTLEYRELRGDVDRQFESIKVFLPNISAAVWNFDETQIQLALAAVIQQPYIERASVAAAGHFQRGWSAGEIDMRNMIARTYVLKHESRGVSSEIGRLEVAASLTQIYWKVADRALSILLSNALKTFAVALFILFLFRRLVTRRLEQLADKVGKLVQAAEPVASGAPSRPATMPRGLDELQAVEWVLENKTRKLRAASAALQSVNRQLVDQVAEKEALLQNALVGIAMLHGDRIVSCNRRFEEIFGYEGGGMIGQSARRLFPSEPEWRDIGKTAHEAETRASGFRLTARVQKREGHCFWAEISGSEVVAERSSCASIWVFSDVTERKSMEAEMVRLRAELWKMLESQLVRHAVAALAHEVNQPLASISALCAAIQRMLDADACPPACAQTASERIKHSVRRLASESERAGEMVRNLMATLQTPAVAVEPISLASVLHEAARAAPSSGFADCEIIVDCLSQMAPVMVNRQQLEKVLLNLIGNAEESMRRAGLAKGRIWISAGMSAEGAKAHVTVRDEGPGINKEMETKVFHPFVTTKPGNLGMGLTISRSLIEALGGRFWLAPDSRPGAQFHFTLPLVN